MKSSVRISLEHATTTREERSGSFWLVLLLVVLCELGYLLLVALSPLPQFELSNTPIALEWTWTLLPFHWLLALTGNLLSNRWIALSLLGATFTGLFIVYGCMLRLVLRLSEQERRRRVWLYILLASAFLFGATLLIQPHLFSDDVFTYIFSGRILTLYHANPFNTAPYQYPGDPYLRWVVSGLNAPNLYGPFWYYTSSLLVSIGGSDQVLTLLLFKGLALFAHLVNIVLIWRVLSYMAPQRRVLGTLMYGWNPLILIELAGSGHSEWMLMFLLFLGTWLFICQRSYSLKWLAFFTFGLALSVNLIVALFIPLLLWFDVRSEIAIERAIRGFCWRLLLVLLPALVIWLPFWRGSSTFFALTSAIDMQHFIHSPIGILVVPTHIFFRLIASDLHFPSAWDPISSADVALRGSATFIFVLIYCYAFGLVRHAPCTTGNIQAPTDTNSDQRSQETGFDTLLFAWNVAAFAYLMLASGWFWPWYLLWVLWVSVLRRFDAFTVTMLLLSGTVIFFYLFVGLLKAPFALYQSTLIFGLPLTYLISVRGRERKRERTGIIHDRRSETA